MTRRPSSSLVYIGIRGRVVALNRRSGEEVWRTALKGAGFVHVTRDAEFVFATTRGEIFCLSPDTGEVIWNNALKGLGMDLASVASDEPMSSSDFSTQASSIQRQRAAAAGAAAAT